MSKLALLGGTPVSATPLHSPWPEYGTEEETGLLEVLRSRAWGGYPEPSPHAGAFAKDFANYHGAAHGVMATNGSVTLEVALNALEVQAGDEIIVPTYTWIATAVCAIHMNAVPVMVDVDPDTYCMDMDAVEAAITPRTRGIIPVHLGSSMADMDRLRDIAKRHDLFIIEDCAHAHGGKWRGEGAGSMGDIGSFSFQVSKLMACGEGGAVIMNDEALAARCHWIVNCGRKEPGFDQFPGSVLGVNARISEFQAAVLQGQLSRLERVTLQREEAAKTLTAGLNEIGGLTPLKRDPRVTVQHHYQLISKYDPAHFAGVHRNRFLEALAAEGVSLDGDFYVPMHDHELFRPANSAQWPQLKARYGGGFEDPETRKNLNFPVCAKAAYDEAVWMHYPYLMGGDAQITRILEAVQKVKTHASDLR